jgi:hypothetical protein
MSCEEGTQDLILSRIFYMKNGKGGVFLMVTITLALSSASGKGGAPGLI